MEVQGLYSPIGWIHELRIGSNPLFVDNQIIRFAKLNLFYGGNGTGKTALTEWLCGFFDINAMERWRNRNTKIKLDLSFLNPQPQYLSMAFDSKALIYKIEGRNVAYIPHGINILKVGSIYYYEGEDDLTTLSRTLNLPKDIIISLIKEIHDFPYSNVSNLVFKENHEGENILYCDVAGTVPGLPLEALSGRETERVFIEFVTAAARLSGRYCPTLLILDGCPSIIFDGLFDFYSHHFLDSDNHFQTIMCIPTKQMNLDSLKWSGWEVVRTNGRAPLVEISQELRVTKV